MAPDMNINIVNLLLIASGFLYLLTPCAAGTCAPKTKYTAINGSLCINGKFVLYVPTVRSELSCSLLCSKLTLCQAFTTVDFLCQLFVFDKCSKSVRDCSCSRKGRVWIKQQSGSELGSLCPAGYGDELCGVKYKIYMSVGDWYSGRQKCESEGGLVIMADVMDSTEMSQVNDLFSKYMSSTSSSLWLGGFQPAGSAEPRGGWYWIGCNITLDGSLWHSVEPDNYGGNENVVGRYPPRPGLADFASNAGNFGVLCKCVNPF